MIHNLPESTCPNCGHWFDTAGSPSSEIGPQAGDYTICFECGHILVFAADLTVRDPTPAEQLVIAGDREMLELQRWRVRVREAQNRRGRPGE